MQGVLEGFATIGVIIALGFLLGHIGMLDLPAQVLLSRLSFFVASPALMVTVLERADVGDVFSKNLAASAGGVAVTAGCYFALARLAWHKDTGDTMIGVLSSVYVNAGNLGLPIAAYVLGDAALVAPVLLMQLLVMQPLALSILDSAASADGAASRNSPANPASAAMSAPARVSPRRVLTRALTNPLTIGSLIGLLLAVTHLHLPRAVHDPLGLIGAMAVPMMLLAYGVSLRLGPLPGAGVSKVEIGSIAVFKLVLQPTVAWGIARFALGLDGNALLAVTVLAALPTAQNIFIHATRYDRAVVVARDSIFVTTMLSVPTLVVITALLT